MRDIKAYPKVLGTQALKNHFETCKKKNLHEFETNQAQIIFNHQKLVRKKHIYNHNKIK